MKRPLALIIVVVIAVPAVTVPLAYFVTSNWGRSSSDKFFFGVTYGQTTVEEAKLLIDKVQNYTNVFVVDSMSISNNETELNQICNYAASKNLHFIVYFFSLFNSTWQQEWPMNARQTWGDKFLGVYLRDEPGGRQIENKEPVANASSYAEAAEKFVQTISDTYSMRLLNGNEISVFTSDFALYWYGYQAGYDVLFAEMGWNNSRPQEIALCRGAATMLGKEWGTIITWTYMQPPYIESPIEAYQDMVTAYNAGAKYVIVFNYPKYPVDNEYGILSEEHFSAMKQFWEYAATHPRQPQKPQDRVALVLPEDYGWGMRKVDDNIWGIWPADNISALIWQNVNKMITIHGANLDIVYADKLETATKTYSKVYFWDDTSL